MTTQKWLQTIRSPSYVVGPDGQPAAVLVDLATWKSIVERLEDQEDSDILRQAAADLEVLARGERPNGWKAWEEFEAELSEWEEAGEVPA
ncbi:MAG TPA: hypothetical protein VIK33_17135 [Anaerolineae bacterium]